MRDIDASVVLGRLQQLSARIEASPLATRVQPEAEAAEAGFGQLLEGAINAVARQQGAAQALQTRFERGDAEVDLGAVMLAMQKASLTFQAATQVRNRLVSAYQDIMNMQV